MSFDFNYKFWLTTNKELNYLIKKQNLLKEKEPVEDAKTTFKILSQMYILYSELVDKLGYLYRETFQVHKKEVIRNLIEPAIKRLLEIKLKLKEIELSVYVYLDETLVERNLTPYDLIIWSSSFVYTRPKDIKAVLLYNEPQRLRRASSEEISQAITKLQSHERARKARMLKKNGISYTKNLTSKISYSFGYKSDVSALVPVKRTIFQSNFIKSSSCGINLAVENFKIIDSVDETKIRELQSKSALIIQMAWKSYRAQKLLKIKLNMKQSLYGLIKTKQIFNREEYEQNIHRMNKNCAKQEELDNKYAQLINDERERLLKAKSPQIMEDISDHIRYWFKEFYENTGDFHPYPNAYRSGAVMLLIDETMSLQEFKEFLKTQELSEDERKNMEQKLKLQKEKQNEKIEKEKRKEIKRQQKMFSAGIYDIGYELKNNKNVEQMERIFSQYAMDWKYVDEYLNKNHDTITEWVTESQLADIHKELRRVVDKYMRMEYNMLKSAWSVDNKKNFKPSKTREKKKNERAKNRKKIIDLTADRTIESLYQEFETAGIIQNYPLKGFEDYMGDFNILADNLRQHNNLITLNPAKGDIKFAIQDILFGMGTFNIEKPKTLCLVGPPNTGKKLLCNIIASSLGALFMNLSPEKTVQFSENIKYFVHVVMKLAKAFQPTIIFIDEAHRIFWKKIPKDEVDIKPTLLQNALTKTILMCIGGKDKIMVIGTSSLPWSADKMFNKVFKNILMVPESDYGSVFLMWLQLLTQNVNRNYFEDYTLSVLAKIFHKYNSGHIIDNATSILNIKRRVRLHLNPLKPDEFLDYFLSQKYPLFPPEEKVLDKYKQWFNKTNNYGKLRLVKASQKVKRQ